MLIFSLKCALKKHKRLNKNKWQFCFLETIFTSSEWFPTPIAASSEVFIVTIGAVDVVILWSEGLIHQRFLALAALEAEFMPMPVLV